MLQANMDIYTTWSGRFEKKYISHFRGIKIIHKQIKLVINSRMYDTYLKNILM